MRKIIISEYVTLDGVFEDPGGAEKTKNGGWSFAFWGDEAMQYKHDELFASDALLLGRVTYEGFAKVWPTMEGTGDFGERMNSMPKYVVSKTLEKSEWNNSYIIRENIAQEIAKLKEQDGKDILVAGSAKLVKLLLELGLADEVRLLLHPVVLGEGRHLFDGIQKKFKLLEAKTFQTGIVALHFEPIEREK